MDATGIVIMIPHALIFPKTQTKDYLDMETHMHVKMKILKKDLKL